MRPDTQPGAILLVDDDPSIRKLVRKLLEDTGYTVIVATDGELGLACFLQNQTAIALVLTDVLMPRMDGRELADRILDLDRTLPVVFMSGTHSADRGYGCVPKPFRASDLLAKVSAALRCGPLSS
jgi:two-component system cell cycle sensor histidine kinase/response regulator CckA